MDKNASMVSGFKGQKGNFHCISAPVTAQAWVEPETSKQQDDKNPETLPPSPQSRPVKVRFSSSDF